MIHIMAAHIIWDNSNIWLGGRRACEEIEQVGALSVFRIHFPSLYKLALNQRDAGRRHIAGSVPPEAESLWEFIRARGFDLTLLHRVSSGKEQAVDELLHLKLANMLL